VMSSSNMKIAMQTAMRVHHLRCMAILLTRAGRALSLLAADHSA
jgi:hypothetical protein